MKRHQHQHQQRHADQEQPRRALLPDPQRHLEHHHRGDQADGQEDAVADQEIGRLVAGEAAALGGGDGGRVHHHQAEQQQRQRRPQQHGVELLRLGRAAGAVAKGHPGAHWISFCRAAASSRTACANTSARCA
jgi:hypothetical protein